MIMTNGTQTGRWNAGEVTMKQNLTIVLAPSVRTGELWVKDFGTPKPYKIVTPKSMDRCRGLSAKYLTVIGLVPLTVEQAEILKECYTESQRPFYVSPVGDFRDQLRNWP